MRIIFIVFVITNGLAAVRLDYKEDRFSFLIKCKRNQELSLLERCLEYSIKSLQYYIRKGEIMSRVEPYYEEDQYQFDSGENFEGFLTLFNIQIQGLANYTISNLSISSDFCKIKFDAMFPQVIIKAMYYMSATVMKERTIKTFPKREIMDAEIKNNQVTVTMEGAFYYKHDKNNNAKQYFYVRDVQVDFNVAWIEYYFQRIDIFPDITKQLNERLNNYWPSFAPGILAQLQHSVAIKIQTIANNVYAVNSMDILMPL